MGVGVDLVFCANGSLGVEVEVDEDLQRLWVSMWNVHAQAYGGSSPSGGQFRQCFTWNAQHDLGGLKVTSEMHTMAPRCPIGARRQDDHRAKTPHDGP